MHVPIIFRVERRAQILFHLVGSFALRQPQPVSDAKNMRVYGNGRLSERHAQHYVSRLSAHARKRDKLVHCLRYAPAEFSDYVITARLYV